MVDERKVPEGYKVTEVGILPGDWSCNSLRDFIYISSGESPSKFRFSNSGIPYFKVEQLNNTSKYQRETPYRILSDKYVPKGSIIFPKRGAAIFLNKIRILNQNSYMDTNLMTLTVNSDQLYNEFLFYLLDSKGLWRIADTTSVPQINNKHILPIIFQNPPLPEQKAIAEALSDTDNLISSLEKLIDKKKKIKQGAMQQLLTGKKRLPGFSGEWRKVKVKDIGYAYGGLSGKSKSDFDGGNKPYITFLNVMNNTIIEISSLRYVRVKSSESQNRVNTGDLLFNTSSETPEEVGMCSVLLGEIDELYLNSFCFGFRIYDQNLFEPLYLAYFFRSNEGRKLFFSLAQGATRYNLSKNLFYNIEFKHPSIQEQKAIAQVLSDMDNEIEALEEKLEKYKTIKQGMMQELLTGRIRLI